MTLKVKPDLSFCCCFFNWYCSQSDLVLYISLQFIFVAGSFEAVGLGTQKCPE